MTDKIIGIVGICFLVQGRKNQVDWLYFRSALVHYVLRQSLLPNAAPVITNMSDLNIASMTPHFTPSHIQTVFKPAFSKTYAGRRIIAKIHMMT